jgi:hypothetical protein
MTKVQQGECPSDLTHTSSKSNVEGPTRGETKSQGASRLTSHAKLHALSQLKDNN